MRYCLLVHRATGAPSPFGCTPWDASMGTGLCRSSSAFRLGTPAFHLWAGGAVGTQQVNVGLRQGAASSA
eukprot:scaffold25029_cov75-Phaeocystis_antarctica.AAC.5